LASGADTAGGNVNNLSVVIPTTGQPTGGRGSAPDIAGGGDLRVEAGGDIRGGVFHVDKGRAEIAAGGAVTQADAASVYPILALGNGQYQVKARKDLAIEGIVNPTVLPISATQGLSDTMPPSASYFFTYAPDSAVRLEAVSGDVLLRGDTDKLKTVSDTLQSLSDTAALTYLPGTLSVRSLQGDMVIGNSFTLIPAPRGDLELLARGDITPIITSTDTTTTIHLSDADSRWLPSLVAPSQSLTNAQAGLATAAIPMHPGDTQPARIVAQTGSIGSPPGSLNKLSFVLSKQARISAGEEVRNLTLKIQHADAGDISVVEAEKSVLFPTERDPLSGKVIINDNKFFEVAGPGQFYVIAGKDVDLGASSGILSVGNQKNPALPKGGADITIMAGQAQAPEYGAFIDRYLASEVTYRDRLAQYMNDLASQETDPTRAEAFRDRPLDSFRTVLSLAQRRKFVLEVLFNELRESSVAAVESKNYERGFDAIRVLFPAASYPGDVKSFLSQITTANGGDINLVVPGGLVNAGVSSSAAFDKTPDQLGIVAQRDGNINAFVRDDFLVNASRVFALDGGDILIWSSTGDIDAGKGAKTALSIPPAESSTDPNTGITTVEFPPPISGSGIGASVRTPGRDPGNVFLAAPVGVINAGDAGISSAGNLTIAATAVLGADNIKVGGASVGVPTDAGGLSAGVAGVGDIAATAGKMAEDVTRGLTEQKEGEEGFLGVEVVGFGEDEQGDEVLNLRKRKRSNNQ
jgi:hypothetical protein